MRFEDLKIGDKLTELSKGPMTAAHIMRWSAAIENWHPLHYDWRYAVKKDGLPDVLVNGSWKQQFLLQLVTDWIGQTAWLFRFGLRYRRMSIPGDTIVASGHITDLRTHNAYGVVDVELRLSDQNGIPNTEGDATIVWPLAGGPALPYPFDPRLLD